MHMLPPQPYTTNSRAEKQVFDLLKEAFYAEDKPFFALHSFMLPHHGYKREAEIDFLICCPYGLYALEVKGGRVSFDGQRWGYTNKQGRQDFSIEGPFRQAKSAMYALRGRLQGQLTSSLFRKITFGYGVVFPECKLSNGFTEWDEQLLCHGGKHRILEQWLRQLIKYWRTKEAEAQILGDQEINLLIDVLRPKQASSIPVSMQVESVHERIRQLTVQQQMLLDAAEVNVRVMCSGSAGTGKTLLAMELARRWVSAGKQVLLVCRSQWLKGFLTAKFRLPNLTISTLDGLPVAVRRANVGCFDALLADEGQDLLDIRFFQQVAPYLRGGFENGQWVFFHDINNQSGLFGAVDQAVLNRLEQLAPVRIPLRRNCRNTAEIVNAIHEYTNADMGIEAVGAGPAVKVLKAENNSQVCNLLEESITEWLDFGDLPAAEITILTDFSSREFMQQFGRFLSSKIAVLDEYAMQYFPPDAISLASINAFKGLENTAIILVINQQNKDFSRERLLRYVGMSRARVLLHVLFY